MNRPQEILVPNLDHLGIVAGIIDEISLVEQVNQLVGQQPGEIVSPGQVVKAIILNGLGFVSALSQVDRYRSCRIASRLEKTRIHTLW